MSATVNNIKLDEFLKLEKQLIRIEKDLANLHLYLYGYTSPTSVGARLVHDQTSPQFQPCDLDITYKLLTNARISAENSLELIKEF